MKTIIAGGRDVTDCLIVRAAIVASGFDTEITEVVSGGARGVDAMGERWAREVGIPVRVFPADWDKHGKAAGPIRNGQMADYADALIAVWNGQSRGTSNMIEQAKAKGLRVFVFRTDKYSPALLRR
jgi:hypothetical protein